MLERVAQATHKTSSLCCALRSSAYCALPPAPFGQVRASLEATSDTACTIDGATLLLHVSSDVASLYLPCGKLGISPYSRNSYAKPWSGLCLRQKAKVASGQTAAHDDFRGFPPVCSPAAVAERCQTGCAAIWQVYDERSNACACLPGGSYGRRPPPGM